ncbi:MAG TPA: hypothetical protein VKB62_04780 [Streptosporangiaceae bacterium]|nr:hypothetical protein [Streptosporangiaceae bacterium]
MSNVIAANDTVVAVLLADGWHQVVPGSFWVGPLGLVAHIELARPGFRFDETRDGSPHRPASVAGPLDSIIAVRQVNRGLSPSQDAVSIAGARGGRRGTRHPALARC